MGVHCWQKRCALAARDDPLEHALGARKLIDLLLDESAVLRRDRVARAIDRDLGLGDGVAAEIRGAHHPLDLREKTLDFGDQGFGFLLGAFAAGASYFTGDMEADRVWNAMSAPAKDVLHRHATLGTYMAVVFGVLAIWRTLLEGIGFFGGSRPVYLIFAVVSAGVTLGEDNVLVSEEERSLRVESVKHTGSPPETNPGKVVAERWGLRLGI